MKKIYWLRRTAALLIAFGLGLLIGNKAIPTWLVIIYASSIMLWLMLYDEAVFERRVKRFDQS